MFRLFTLLALLWPLCLGAQEAVVADMSQKQVSITTSFAGSKILIFGAVKGSPTEPHDPLGVIVTVTGPELPVVVRKKDRRFGIWVNTDAAEIDAAPTFYAVATSGPLDDLLSETEDLARKITIDRAIRAVGVATEARDGIEFKDALIRIREASGSYVKQSGIVNLTQDALFSTEVLLPANLVEGDYDVAIYLTRNGAVTAEFTDQITVSKVGLERFIYNLAHERPLIYGLLSLFIAISAGWGASAIFQAIRF